MTLTSPKHPLRPTTRVLLLDRQDRILLLKGRPHANAKGEGAWFTVGGGLEPGETHHDAAAREIVEETGFHDFELGAVVWVREGVLAIPEPTHFREQYIVARCQGREPRRDGWTSVERELIEDIRWWTLDDLQTTAERVFPPGLAGLLSPILRGLFPATPLSIPWD
mgnify:FL=1